MQTITTNDQWTLATVNTAVAIAKAAAVGSTMADAIGATARQGDVLAIRVADKAVNAEPTDKDIILVKGEASGHQHVIKSRNARYELITGALNVLGTLVLGQESVLVHDEHSPIVMPCGTYEIRRQLQGSEYQDLVRD